MKLSPINMAYKPQNFVNTTLKKQTRILNNRNLQKAALITTVAFLSMISSPKINAKTENKKNYTKTETVQYTKDFKLNNKDYTMICTDNGFSNVIDDNAIADIYFVPQNHSGKILKLEHLYHQKIEGEKDIVIAVVTDYNENPETPKQPPQEIKLPEEIGKTLLGFYQGKSEFFLIPGSNTYTEM